MTGLGASARRARKTAPAAALARLGLAARAFVYVVIGWLALQIAAGHHTEQANQRGALAEVAGQPLGKVLVWITGIGFAGYALWRLSEAALGTAAEGDDAGPRLKSLARGLVYLGLAVSTISFVTGNSNQGQAQQQATTTAKLLRHSYGQWLVGLAGVIVVVVGAVMVFEGARKKFEKDLRLDGLSATTRKVVVSLGVVGTIARGVVFCVAGVLVVDAAVTYDPKESSGIDGALRTLAAQSFGPWLLGALAVGLIAFGAYGFAAARWAKV
jgi:hypothetical protein